MFHHLALAADATLVSWEGKNPYAFSPILPTSEGPLENEGCGRGWTLLLYGAPADIGTHFFPSLLVDVPQVLSDSPYLFTLG